MQRAIYLVVRFLMRVYYRILFRTDVRGLENVPKDQGAILCANHISNYDPITLAIYLPRLPRYMAKKELFQVAGLGWLIRNLKAFPVDRNAADMNAFKSAVKVLKEKELVGMFAQGTRVKPGEEKAAKAGVALFAMKGNAPVVPVAIQGDYRPFSYLRITYGKPLYFEEYRGKRLDSETLELITHQVMAEINRMLVEE